MVLGLGLAVSPGIGPGSGVLDAHAVDSSRQGNALVPYEAPSELDNTGAPALVATPKYSEDSAVKRNFFRTEAGNAKYTFRSEYFLPAHGAKPSYWSNTQAIAMVGKYMYVLSATGQDKGFITRYDTAALKNLKVSSARLAALRDYGLARAAGKASSALDKKLTKAIKQGPQFTVGHGQSMAYDPVSQQLWMWQDDTEAKARIKKLLAISSDTLRPVHRYEFTMQIAGKDLPRGNNLCFDDAGNFYFDSIQAQASGATSKGSERIYAGRIDNGKVTIHLLPQAIKNRPGELGQSIAFNPAARRLYLISDSAFSSFPVDKANAGTLEPADFQYTVLNTKREFEGIAFDSGGYGHLLVVRGPEVLRSTAPM
jgi:hypothetical protein